MARYFEKTAGPLVAMLGWGGGKLLGSKMFTPLVKTFGSQATLDGLAAGGSKLTGSALTNMQTAVAKTIPQSRLGYVNNPSIAKDLAGMKGNRIRDYIAEHGDDSWRHLKGIRDYAKNEIISGPGTGFKAVRTALRNDSYALNESGNVYRKSIGASMAAKGLQHGTNAYFIGDAAFGKLGPGESRTGKVLGAGGFTYGALSARKGIAGMVRGLGLNMAGTKIGDSMTGMTATNTVPKIGQTMKAHQLPKLDEMQKVTMNYQ